MAGLACTIVAIERLCSSVRELWLARSDGLPLRFQPGQHLMVRERDAAGRVVEGAFSICHPPREDGRFAICVRSREDSDCAAVLFRRERGAELRCSGPQGSLVLSEPVDSALLLVATGTGIAPFRAMRDQLARAAERHAVWLLHGARDGSDLFYHDDWRDLARQTPRFHYRPVLSRPRDGDRWSGPAGRVGALLDALPAVAKGVRVYLCGHAEMVDDVAARLIRGGVAPEAIHREQ